MKLLWQQIIGVLTVLMVALGLSAYFISDYMTDQIYNQRQKELVQYGANIVANHFTRNDLVRVSQLLESQEIVIQVYLADGTVIYPSYDQRNKLQLSEEQLTRITNGETIGIVRSKRYNSQGEEINLATVYVSNKGGYSEFPEGFIGIGAPLSDLDQQIKAVQQNIMLGFSLSAGIGIIMTVLYAMYQSRKINKLQQATREIASGNYEIELDTSGKDELSELAIDFQAMAKALQASENEVKRQESLRRQMMMDAAHEMRTPLTTMSGVLEGLQYDLIPEEQKGRSLELVMRETQRLTRLVNENLDYEKIRSRQIVLKYQWVNVKMLFDQIAQQLEGKAQSKGDYFTINVAEDVNVWADNDRIVQIVMNLVTNAIQFSENSEIILKANQDSDFVNMMIKDYGIGIDPEQIESIWERFYKADISRKNTQFGESGIGLSVVKSLVEAHQGEVKVASEEGKGTTFTLKFPLKKDANK